ncbi:ABC transporter ATP-binding protein [Photobacterium carnosum]|uniref:ABC transporter ATP-binding protein n=1 Tax=Photobacterium iliopiscarium TaxID=56192 RepID=A0A2T3M7Q7_9GAMM|nr:MULTISPECIES: ABC transporter ATP-binding protein [Photobacterium]MBY3790036.1 ABC transporter ATP-binding protein [Photobacterium carnosum]MCD9524146.1 ATP-binding cassette domain-containing protein [Photobacterium carnosum]MCD9535738.1 ATP-binding cassette domain-containing protein [Photobacterium carnosum]PSV88307.1 ABC transporter ATP-binding protein [Photobacterium iliopiscarium]
MTSHLKICLTVNQLQFGPNVPLFLPMSFVCHQGEVCAILGANGRGKTTLLHNLVNIQSALTGDIFVHGGIGFVPQSCAFAFSYSVIDVVLMGLAQKIGLFFQPSDDDIKRALAALADLAISGLADSLFIQLSGGQQQLVLIARALVADCVVIALDEPTSALDLHNQQTVLRLLQTLARRDNKCVIFTTHDPSHALLIADKALLLFPQGEWLFDDCQEILNQSNLQQAYGINTKQATFIVDQQPYKTIIPLFDGLN